MDECTIVRRRDALAAGRADHELRAMYTRGGWQRLAHGVYVPSAALSELSERARHRLMIEAVLPSLAPGAVISHESAAVLHGLPLPRGTLDRVHVTRDRRGGGRANAGAMVHCAPLGPVDHVDGIPVTDLARTVVDVARVTSFEAAVIAGDVAVRVCAPDRLEGELARAVGWKGVAQARRVVPFLDGRSESPGESLSRVVFADAGYLPEPQVEIHTATGRLIGRVDLCFGGRVIGEMDGKVKYTKFLVPGQEAGDVVFAEKIREDEIRDTGLQVVRWTWADLLKPAELIERLERALERADRLPPPTAVFRSTSARQMRAV